MPFLSKNKRVLITLASASFIIGGTLFAIQFAKGYRPTTQGTLQGTGLLSVTSNPKNSLVSINGVLSDRVTDDTVSLQPGEYDVEIFQDGFTTWRKRLTIEKELVTATDAHLFRSVPSLQPLTFAGAQNITPSPDGQKVAFAIASPSAQLKAGLYMLELTDRQFFGKGARLLAENPSNGFDFQDANLLWSPDSNQILTSFETINYLLDIRRTTQAADLVDATSELSFLFQNWEQEIKDREKQLLLQLPDEMQAVATASAKNLYFSPEGQKLLYTATANVTIPEGLIPPLPASSTQPQERELQPGSIYVYDLEEDKNFLIKRHPAELPEEEFTKIQIIKDLTEQSVFSATESAQLVLEDPVSLAQTITNYRTQYSSFPFLNYQWFPTSKHLLFNENGTIRIMEYDATNQTDLFSGPYLEDFVYPWPNGDKIIILTNFTQNPALPPNLYTINLK